MSDTENVRPSRARRGTKDTQGINGEAALLQRFGGAVMAFAGSADLCPYPAHRPTDWRLKGERASERLPTCGVCHPPARGLEVELIGAAE